MPAESVTPAALEPDLLGCVDFFTEVPETRGNPIEAAEELEELSRHYRALGICRLSADADADGFFHYLIQSALTRRFYLEAAQAAGGCLRRVPFARLPAGVLHQRVAPTAVADLCSPAAPGASVLH